MALRFEINPGEAQVHIIGTGMLTMPAMLEAVEQVADDPRFSPHFSVIFDLSDGDYTAELADGDAFVKVLKRRLEDFRNKFALVVPDHLQFLGTLYSVLAGVGGFDRMRCFADLEKARQWCRSSG